MRVQGLVKIMVREVFFQHFSTINDEIGFELVSQLRTKFMQYTILHLKGESQLSAFFGTL